MQANPLELEARIVAAKGELDMAKLNLERINNLTFQEYWEKETAELRLDIAQEALDILLSIRNNPQEINAAVDNAHARSGDSSGSGGCR